MRRARREFDQNPRSIARTFVSEQRGRMTNSTASRCFGQQTPLGGLRRLRSPRRLLKNSRMPRAANFRKIARSQAQA